jgi:hypothetical protein
MVITETFQPGMFNIMPFTFDPNQELDYSISVYGKHTQRNVWHGAFSLP